MAEEKKNNTLGIVLIVVLILIIIGILITVFVNNGDDDEESDSDDTTEMVEEVSNEDSMIEESNEDEESVRETENPLAAFVGTYDGTSQLLTSIFNFPSTIYTLDETGSFTLAAEGLDLSLTQLPSLQINGVFPEGEVGATGVAVPQEDGSVQMQISSFIIEFTLDGEPLDAVTSAAILEGLTAEYNIVIPEVSETQPLIVDTQVSLNESGEFTISNKPGVEGQVVVSLTGTKVE